MDIRATVIDELRAMFKEGATPTRLIQHIVARHPHERNWHGLIQGYFREGFGVEIVRGLNPTEHYDHIDLRYAHLNEDVLHEMVQMRSFWDQEQPKADALSPSWLASLTAKSTLERILELERSEAPALVQSSDRFDPKERAASIRTSANLHTRIEMCHILARLVERLQQRIVAMERRQSDRSVPSSSLLPFEASSEQDKISGRVVKGS